MTYEDLRHVGFAPSECVYILEAIEKERADERAKVIDELKPFFDEVSDYTLDWICDDLCGEFINPQTNECWCAEHCNNGTGYECIKKWCELKRRA